MAFGKDEHDAEVAEQAEIEANIAPDPAPAPEETVADAPQAEVDEVEVPQITITPDASADIEYPLVVSLANREDIVFESASDTADVPAAILEDVKPIAAVEVAA